MSSPILKKCFKFVEDYFRHLMTHFLAVLSDTKKRRETVQCFEKLKILHQGRMSESAKENDNEDEPSSATINQDLWTRVSHVKLMPILFTICRYFV